LVDQVLQDKKTRDSRIHRIARGSGRSLREANELLEQFKHFEKVSFLKRLVLS
jgi:signal recognition particle GTPase